MDDFLNIVKARAAQLDQGWGQARLGTVTSVDPDTYTARVAIQPENVLSGWLPIASLWVGNGWGLACPPSPGDQVLVISHEGDSQQGLLIGRIWSKAAKPVAATSGEFWMVHEKGSYLKLLNDGSIESCTGTWTHHGDFIATGNVYDAHGSVASLRIHYNEHTHPPSDQGPDPQD